MRWCLSIGLVVVVYVLAVIGPNADWGVRTVFEVGDQAVDSIQVLHAERFAEIHGHYSKLGVMHPGPALHYVRAVGEVVFHDALHVVRSPLVAQMLSLFLVNSIFIGLMLVMLLRRSGPTEKIVVVGIWAVALLYLTEIVRFPLELRPLVIGIWAPTALFAPFACYVVACAAWACGAWRALPVMVLAGGVLVHGHATGSVFVAVLFVASAAVLLRDGAAARRCTQHKASILLAAAFLLVFVLPLGLDVLSDSSNLLRYGNPPYSAPRAATGEMFRSVLSYWLLGPAFTDWAPAPTIGAMFAAMKQMVWIRAGLAAVYAVVICSLLVPSLRRRWSAVDRAVLGLLVLASACAFALMLVTGEAQLYVFFYLYGTPFLVLSVAVRWAGSVVAFDRLEGLAGFGLPVALAVTVAFWPSKFDYVPADEKFVDAVDFVDRALPDKASPIAVAGDRDAWSPAAGLYLAMMRQHRPVCHDGINVLTYIREPPCPTGVAGRVPTIVVHSKEGCDTQCFLLERAGLAVSVRRPAP